MNDVPEFVHAGELVRYPGPWDFYVGQGGSLLLSGDEDLLALEDPERKLNLAHTLQPDVRSLRETCERAQAAGQSTLVFSIDHFFSQYRGGGTGIRRLTPDSEEYVRRIAAVSRLAGRYGLGLELSLLSPLEIGPAYGKATGESGVWMQWRKGLRDPSSGDFCVELWHHQRWVNNKGVLALEDAGVRVFAFKQQALGGTPYLCVKPEDMVDVTEGVQVEKLPGCAVERGPACMRLERVRVRGCGCPQAGGLDRVLVIWKYRTPEMDYFSDRAWPFLRDLVDRYVDAGIRIDALYADEMHIQQDWGYHNHHEHGEFAMRYVSPHLARRFAERFGSRFEDFERYLLYFCQGQEDASHGLAPARANVQHLWGETPEAVADVVQFRSRYYRLLSDTVVDLFVRAKRHLEARVGHRLRARAHATWAESPTIDLWRAPAPTRLEAGNGFSRQYEYTPDFIASNTAHQSAAACDDYFKWGEFLTGNGNDNCECGWLDRNYTGPALACSTGLVNEVPYSYSAHWGMPEELARRRQAVVNAFGAGAELPFGLVQDLTHRVVDVLMLYPLDLVALDGRFGSWMTQYAYADCLTSSKLLELGKVVNGALEIRGRRYTTLAAVCEPLASEALLELMRRLVESGGRVIWSGPPVLKTSEAGSGTVAAWERLFGVHGDWGMNVGLWMPGRVVKFEGSLSGVPDQVILTDFQVDHVYPVELAEGARSAARVQHRVVGAVRQVGQGQAVYLGFRPRDDQSASLGYESRTWFELLRRLGAYAGSGGPGGPEDNPEVLSRSGPYVFCRFPNGALAAAPHLTTVVECWEGGFARDTQKDQQALKNVELPSEELVLERQRIWGHEVSYRGAGAMAARINEQGNLIAFAGRRCAEITADGKTHRWGEGQIPLLAFGPVNPERRVEPRVLMQIRVDVTAPRKVRVPVAGLGSPLELVAEGPGPGSRGQAVPARLDGDWLDISAEPGLSGKWLYVLGR